MSEFQGGETIITEAERQRIVEEQLLIRQKLKDPKVTAGEKLSLGEQLVDSGVELAALVDIDRYPEIYPKVRRLRQEYSDLGDQINMTPDRLKQQRLRASQLQIRGEITDVTDPLFQDTDTPDSGRA